MKIDTSDLIGAALDYAVALAAGTLRGGDGCWHVIIPEQSNVRQQRFPACFKPSTDWSHAGPIIEREGIALRRDPPNYWVANLSKWAEVQYVSGLAKRYCSMQGGTPLVAAMRCFVASKLGDVVDIPDKFATAGV